MQIPEKFQNEDGTLKTDALLKSYSELEKKINSMISIPSDDATDEQKEKFRQAIGVPKDISEYPSNPIYDDDSIRKKFLEIGLNNKQVEKIYEIADDFFYPAMSEIFQSKYETDAIGELKNFFGSDEKMRDGLIAVQTFGEKFLPADAFESLCSTPQGIRSVYTMMQTMEPNVSMSGNQSESITEHSLKQMMRDPKYWRDNDPEYIRKIENGFKKLYS